MPSIVLLPTPLPLKMPILWPLPQVSSASMVRTPVAIGSEMVRRCIGLLASR